MIAYATNSNLNSPPNAFNITDKMHVWQKHQKKQSCCLEALSQSQKGKAIAISDHFPTSPGKTPFICWSLCTSPYLGCIIHWNIVTCHAPVNVNFLTPSTAISCRTSDYFYNHLKLQVHKHEEHTITTNITWHLLPPHKQPNNWCNCVACPLASWRVGSH